MNIISEDISGGVRFNKLYQLMSQSVLSAAWLVVYHVTQSSAGNNRNSCRNHEMIIIYNLIRRWSKYSKE